MAEPSLEIELKIERRRIIRIGASLGLSPQESAIAALIHREAPDKKIVAQLGIKRPTVRGYLERAKRKLKALTRIGVAVHWEKAESAWLRMTSKRTP